MGTGGDCPQGCTVYKRIRANINRLSRETPSVASGHTYPEPRRYSQFTRNPVNLPITGAGKDCNLTYLKPPEHWHQPCAEISNSTDLRYVKDLGC